MVNFPWEFYYIPRKWAFEMVHNVDEVWVPTVFVKDRLVASGVPADMVVVIPHGVDFAQFVHVRDGTPKPTKLQAEASQICGDGAFTYLFHGGVLHRKAADLLMEAYLDTFTKNEKVCLIVHSTYWDFEPFEKILRLLSTAIGRSVQWVPVATPELEPDEVVSLSRFKPMSDGMIKHMGIVRCGQLPDCHAICHVNGELRYYMKPVPMVVPRTSPELWQCVGVAGKPTDVAAPRSPRVVISTEFLSTDELDGLFAMSDVLVHASRSEGFGLAVAEAMASGLSVITSDKGAVADFTSADTVWQVESKFVDCTGFPCTSGPQPAVFDQSTKAQPRWLDYSTQALGSTMKAVWQQPAEAAKRATAAKKYVAESMSWSSVGALVRTRITALRVA